MIHSTLEEQLGCTCPNCGKEHNAKFFSVFVSRMHYVAGDCERCGYRIEFRKDELGGGLFMPDGDVTTVSEVFKRESVEHMKEALGAREAPAPRMRLRFLDNEPIREERQR